MRLTVIGSTGRTGRLVLDEGIRRGHSVTAFTRRPAELRTVEGLERVVPGDGRDPEALRPALMGTDAVIAIVGPPSRRGPHDVAAVAEALVTAMSAVDVSRLVITSAYPLVADRPRAALWVLRRVFAATYADTAAMEKVVTATDLDWTIVRINRLTDKAPTGQLVTAVDELLPRSRPMSRTDAASLLIDIAVEHQMSRAAVNVSGP
jgi:putative NADH-flavin reductase